MTTEGDVNELLKRSDDIRMKAFEKKLDSHVARESEWEARILKIENAIFGDTDVGELGMKAELKSLLQISTRVDNWLDGTARLGKLTLSVLLGLSALLGILNILHFTG